MKKGTTKLFGVKGSFKRNALVMSGGAAINVLVSIGLYPIVTRLFTKEDFGIYGIFVAMVSTFFMLSSLQFPSAFVIPKHERDFYALLKIVISTLGIALVTLTVLILIGKPILNFFFESNKLGNIIYLLPIGLLLGGFQSIFTNWNVRNKMFKENAKSSVGSAVSMKSANIIFGLANGSTAVGLIVSQFLSTITSIYLLGFKTLVKKLPIINRISFEEMKTVFTKYRKYPFNLLPGNLINKYTADLPLYMLTAYFNPAVAGAFVLANQMLTVPLNVLGKSLSPVFIQKVNEMHLTNPSEISKFTIKASYRMLILGSLAFGFIFGFGDIVFGFVFGSPWVEAGQIAMLLSAYYILQLVSAPLTGVFQVVGKEQYGMYVSILLAILRSTGIYLGVSTGNVLDALTYFTIANVIGYAVTLVLVFAVSGIPVIKMLLYTISIISIVFLAFYGLRYFIDINFDLFLLLGISNNE